MAHLVRDTLLTEHHLDGHAVRLATLLAAGVDLHGSLRLNEQGEVGLVLRGVVFVRLEADAERASGHIVCVRLQKEGPVW